MPPAPILSSDLASPAQPLVLLPALGHVPPRAVGQSQADPLFPGPQTGPPAAKPLHANAAAQAVAESCKLAL
eukprot:5844383-Amphidinium_carterae.3